MSFFFVLFATAAATAKEARTSRKLDGRQKTTTLFFIFLWFCFWFWCPLRPRICTHKYTFASYNFFSVSYFLFILRYCFVAQFARLIITFCCCQCFFFVCLFCCCYRLFLHSVRIYLSFDRHSGTDLFLSGFWFFFPSLFTSLISNRCGCCGCCGLF